MSNWINKMELKKTVLFSNRTWLLFVTSRSWKDFIIKRWWRLFLDVKSRYLFKTKYSVPWQEVTDEKTGFLVSRSLTLSFCVILPPPTPKRHLFRRIKSGVFVPQGGKGGDAPITCVWWTTIPYLWPCYLNKLLVGIIDGPAINIILSRHKSSFPKRSVAPYA